MTTRRIGILGGTFDPIHCGHLDVGQVAEAALGLTEMLVVTSNIPPHRPQPLASSYHRFAMVALAISGRETWRASDVELTAGATSYTAGTLQRFHDSGVSAAELFFIIGTDAFADVESWKDYPAILDRANFAVVSRPGRPIAEMPDRLPALAQRMTTDAGSPSTGSPRIFLIDGKTADVSATAIRRQCLDGQSITGLVPRLVQQHIEQHGLYSSSLADPSGLALRGGHQTSAASRLHGQD